MGSYRASRTVQLMEKREEMETTHPVPDRHELLRNRRLALEVSKKPPSLRLLGSLGLFLM